MQQRKSSARQKAVSDPQRAVAQPLARAARAPAAAPASAPQSPPSSTQIGSGETTLGGHVDRGLTLAALYDIGVLERLRLEVRLRLISDLTQSLAWLHANPRLMASHPHLVIAPSTVVIGLDGVARVDVRAAKKKDAERDPNEQDYIAPELAGGETGADLRADIYSVGVLAWEALAGTRIAEASEHDGSSATAADADVPLALRASSTQRDPLRRSPAGRDAPKDSQSRLRAPPPLTLPEHAAWARPFAELVLRALCHDTSERLQDCRPLLVELEAIGAFLAKTQEIAEVVQGISNVETLCVPAPTLPDADAACQAGAERIGFMDRQRCEDTRALVCAQRPRPAVHRVEAAPAEPERQAPSAASAPTQGALPKPPARAAHPTVSPYVWLIVGLVVLALLSSVAGFVVSALASR
jgi:hypothetical protein